MSANLNIDIICFSYDCSSTHPNNTLLDHHQNPTNSNSKHSQPWNPYFAYAGLLSGKGEGDCSKEAEARRRNILRKKVVRNQRGVLGTPPPVCGRKHEDVQTDKYLEELFEKPPEIEVACQTDLFLHRPPSPPFVPSNVGIDKATEILEGELFDFDTEVHPILETLVGHTLEQGLIELLHEEEIADIKFKQQELLALREADLGELRRLEAEELRLQAEKDRRLRQDSISKHLDAEMQDKVTAARLLQGHIANLVPVVLKQLEPLNEAENREELERKLCPWLTQQVAEEVGNMIDSREILTAIVKEILVQRAQVYNIDYEFTSSDEQLVCFEEGMSDTQAAHFYDIAHDDDDLNIVDFDKANQLNPDSDLMFVANQQSSSEKEPEYSENDKP